MCQEHAQNGETRSRVHPGDDHEHIEHDPEHEHERDAYADPHANEAGVEDVHEDEPMTAPNTR